MSRWTTNINILILNILKIFLLQMFVSKRMIQKVKKSAWKISLYKNKYNKLAIFCLSHTVAKRKEIGDILIRLYSYLRKMAVILLRQRLSQLF